MTTAVAGMLYLSLGIVHHVNQPFFFAVCQNFHGFIPGDFTRQTFVDHKLRHFVIFETDFQTVVAIGAAKYLGWHAAGAMCDSDSTGRLNNGSHLFVGHHALHFNIKAYIGRAVFIRLGGCAAIDGSGCWYWKIIQHKFGHAPGLLIFLTAPEKGLGNSVADLQ